MVAAAMAPATEGGAKRRKKRCSGEGMTLSRVRSLGHDLLSSRANLNNAPVLLALLSPSSSSSTPLDVALEALISLQSFFVPLVPDLPSKSLAGLDGGAGSASDPEEVFRSWLRSRFDEFIGSLVQIVVSGEATSDALRDVALDAVMDFVKMGKAGRFQSAIYHRLITNMVYTSEPIDALLMLLKSKYFSYSDVRYFTYISLEKISRSFQATDTKESGKDGSEKEDASRDESVIQNIHSILSCFPALNLDKDGKQHHDMWSELGVSSDKESHHSMMDGTKSQMTKKLKSKCTKAWLSFLKLPLPLHVYKEVLAGLHQNVIPNMNTPAMLCDFLTRSYEIGGLIGVMALSGLFILMTQHGIEYPKFYEKLYVLLTPSVFMAKHRAVFFQLLDTCLKSSYLPAYLAVAFAKKLSRLSLYVQPSGALIIIALIHNLLRRHPSINHLVHRVPGDKENEGSEANPQGKPGVDPFDDKEKDPLKCGAMRSSLWEIDTLRHHYCPAVSRFVESLEKDLTVKAKTSEMAVADFSSGSYATVFKHEIQRRIKQIPVAFHSITPTKLFSEVDFPGWTCRGNLQLDDQSGAICMDDGVEASKKRKVEAT